MLYCHTCAGYGAPLRSGTAPRRANMEAAKLERSHPDGACPPPALPTPLQHALPHGPGASARTRGARDATGALIRFFGYNAKLTV